MLALRLDTTYLDLPVGGFIQIAFHNPLFDEYSAEALYSFPFNLPATPINLYALDHANRLDNSGNNTTYTNVVLEICGLPFEHGVLELDEQEFSNEYIRVIFRNQVEDINKVFDVIKLDEIMGTVSSQLNAPAGEWKLLAIDPPAFYEVVINGTAYQVTLAESASLSVFQVLQLMRDRINADIPGMAQSTFSLLILDAELVELNPVNAWNNAFSVSSITTPSQAIYQGFLNHLDEVNTNPISSHAYPQVKWPDFYNGNNAVRFRGWVNPWIDNEHIDNELSATPEWAATYVPFVRVAYIFNKIAAAQSLIIGFAGEFYNTEIQALLQFNNRALDSVSLNYYSTVERKYLNHFQQEIDLNKHVPKMTASEYIRFFMDSFRYYYKIIGQYIHFYKKRDILDGTPIDWTSISEPGFVAVRKKRQGFKIEYSDSPDEYSVPGELDAFVSGDGQTIFTLPFSTPYMFTGRSQKGIVEIKCPIVKQIGSSDFGGIGKNDAGFRFLIDRGLQPASNSENYPMASHDNKDYYGTPNGTLSLDLNAADGLYHQYHKGIPELLADGQPFTIPVRLAIHDILELRKWNNARRTITLPHGQVTAVIKSVQFKATSAGIGISLVEFVQEK